MFDSISYHKGAGVLRMLKEYIGDKVCLKYYFEEIFYINFKVKAFSDGLHNYFATYKYSNTQSDQLWEVFSKSSGKKIKEFMRNWVNSKMTNHLFVY
jgi:aminopeptidase N